MTHTRKIPPLPRSDIPAANPSTGKWETTWYRTLHELWLTLEGMFSVTSPHEQIYAAAPPTSGAWNAGDRVWCDPIQIGDPEYWLCVQSGTPGAWSPGPVIDPGIPGLELWLDASDTSTINIDSSNGVMSWSDKRNRDFIFQQQTPSSRPVVQSAAQNGRNTFRFSSASTQHLVLSYGTTSGKVIEPYTSISVKRRGGPAGANQVALIGGTAGPVICWWKPDGAVRIFGDGEYFDTPVSAATNYVQFTTDKSPGAAHAWINGASLSVTGPNASTSGNTFVYAGVGDDGFGYKYTNGEIAEFLIYNRVLTAAERQLVENYLKTKWGT